jgi:hypothetical protein
MATNDARILKSIWWLVIEARGAEGKGEYGRSRLLLESVSLLLGTLEDDPSADKFGSKLAELAGVDELFLKAFRAYDGTHGF